MSDKKPVNVGTIGHVDHGKTTLTAALVAVCDKVHRELDTCEYELSGKRVVVVGTGPSQMPSEMEILSAPIEVSAEPRRSRGKGKKIKPWQR